MESPVPSSESGTFGPSPSYSSFNQSRKRKYSQAAEPPAREYGVMRDTGRHDTSRFVGSGSGIHFVKAVYLRLSRKSASRGVDSQGIDHLVPGEDDQLQQGQTSRDGSQQCLWKNYEVAGEDETSQVPPTFEQLVAWSKSYFRAWHPMLPFLNAPDVLDIFEKVADQGLSSVSHLEQAILRSVLSISLADSRQSVPFEVAVPASLLFQTIEEAMSASQFALYQPASLHATQAALSIQLFLMSMLRLNAASRLGGLIVRMAFHLGLHRCPSRYPFFTKQEAQIRRRVFWSLYCNERFLSQSLGLPLDIRDDDVDVCYPGEEMHSTEVEADVSRLRLLAYLAKHARIRGLILELRNKSISSRDDTPSHESYVQAEMWRWSNEIHDAIEADEDDDGISDPAEPTLSPAHRVYLLLLKFESKISLNRPMMASDPSTGSYSAGLQNCIFAARSILIALKKHQSRYKAQGANALALMEPILWPTTTWAVWISSFILLYAASERQLPLPSALRHIEAGKDSLRHAAARGTAWPEYCLSAIDELSAAVREVPHAAPGQDRGVSRQQDISNQATMSSSKSTTERRSTRLRRGTVGFSPTVASSAGIPDDSSPAGNDRNSRAQEAPRAMGGTQDGLSGVGRPVASEHMGYSDMHRQRLPTSPLGDPSAWQTGSTQPISATPGDSGSFDLEGQRFPSSATPGMFSFPLQEALLREGQESMDWYNQLFANSLGAIDYPYMAAAQFDSSVDPTWSYLR